MLRTPLLSANELQRRNRVIRLFQTDRTIRERIQLDLQHLGRSDTNVITSLVWGEAPSSTRVRHLYSFLALLAAISAVGAPLLWGTRGIAVIIVVYLINLLATYGMRARLYLAIAAMRYQGSMILAARQVASLDCPPLADYCGRLRNASLATREIARKTFLLFPEGAISSDIGTLIYAHLDIYFLMNVRTFHAVMEETNRHRDELRTIYSLLGELDALQSVASYREGLPAYVEPTFLDRETQLRIEEARHPLLQDPVPNSITIHEGGATITGSNMAGKTTFLRTLGVNVVLAQTVCTCLASSYVASPLRIFSLINDADSLLEGKSYYLVQAEHLLKMIRSSEREGRTLCLIDEPLAGTNSSERSAASYEILRYLAGHNATVVLATHDLELARRLQDTFRNYCFTGQVTGKGLEFDFRLNEGITPTRNAIDLLRYLGFPETVVEQAGRQVP
jgi:DNA mismatch repair ATPase MutS